MPLYGFMPDIFSPNNYFLNPHALPDFAGALIVILIGIFVFAKNHKQKTNIIFFLFSAVSFGFMAARGIERLAANEPAALFWSRITFIFISLTAPLAVHYIYSFFGIDKRYSKFLAAYYAVMSAFIALNLSPFWNLFLAGEKKYWFGYYPAFGPAGYVYLPIFILMLAIMATVTTANYRKIAVPLKKKQSLFVLTALFISCFSVVDFAPVFGFALYPISYATFSVFAAINAYAIIRFKAFALTPQIATERIIAILGDSLILINKDKNITYANPAALRQLGYPEAELVGQPIEKIVAKAFACEPAGWKELTEKERMIENGAKFKTKEGKEIPVKLSLSAIKNPAGDLLGIVCLAHDMARTNEILEELGRKTSDLEKIKADLEEKEKELMDKVVILENFKKVMKGEF